MSTPSYKGSGQPIRSAQGGIADFLGGLFGGAEPSYKTTPTPAPSTAPTTPPPAPTQAPMPMPMPVPLCPSCPLIATCPVQVSDAAGGTDDAVIPIGPAPITIVIQSRS